MNDLEKSRGHVAFIGEFEFYTVPSGDLYWARIDSPRDSEGNRLGEFYTTARGADFALRIARLAAGEARERTED